MSRPVRAMLIFLVGIISPVRREFGEAITSRKTKWSLREWLHKMCTGETANYVLKEICAVNYDNELAKRIGLSPNLGRYVSEFSLAEQGAIARDCESLTRSLLKREHDFFFFYQRMPFLRWAGLYHPDEKVVGNTLLWSRNLWSSLYIKRRRFVGRVKRGLANGARRFCSAVIFGSGRSLLVYRKAIGPCWYRLSLRRR